MNIQHNSPQCKKNFGQLQEVQWRATKTDGEGSPNYRWGRREELKQCQHPLPVSHSLVPPDWQAASQSLSTSHNCRSFLSHVLTSFAGYVSDGAWSLAPCALYLIKTDLDHLKRLQWLTFSFMIPGCYYHGFYLSSLLPSLTHHLYLLSKRIQHRVTITGSKHSSLGRERARLQPVCRVSAPQSKINNTEGEKGEISHYFRRNF